MYKGKDRVTTAEEEETEMRTLTSRPHGSHIQKVESFSYQPEKQRPVQEDEGKYEKDTMTLKSITIKDV